MKKEDIEKYNVTVTGLNESDMSTKDALAAGYITQTGFAESINSTTAGDPVASGSEGHSTEGHSETNPAPGSTSNPTGASSETGNTTTIGGTEFPNDKSVFVANAGSALIKIAALSSKDLDSLVSLYKLDQESTWPSATDWKKMNVITKRSTVKSALGLA